MCLSARCLERLSPAGDLRDGCLREHWALLTEGWDGYDTCYTERPAPRESSR